MGAGFALAGKGQRVAAVGGGRDRELGHGAVRDDRDGARRIRRAVSKRREVAAGFGGGRVQFRESRGGEDRGAEGGTRFESEGLAVEAGGVVVGGADGAFAGGPGTRGVGNFE